MGVKRNLILLVLISFLVSAGFGAINLLVPYYVMALKGVLTELPEKLSHIHAHRVAVEVGVLSTAFMATRSLVAFGSGRVSDILGRKKVIVTGMTLYVIVSVGYVFADSVAALIVLRAVQGVASAMVWPVAEALIVDSVGVAWRTRALSLYVMAMNIGHVGGPVIGGLAYEFSKIVSSNDVLTILRMPFLLLAFFTLPGLMASLAIREPSQTPALKSKMHGVRPRGAGIMFKRLWPFYVNGFVNGFAMGMVMSIMMVYMVEFVVKDPQSVAILMATAGFAGLFSAYPFAKIADNLGPRGRKRMLITTMTIGRISLALTGFARTPLAMLTVLLVMNISFNAMMPLLRSIQATLAPFEARGAVFGAQQAFFNAGMALGPLIGAVLYHALFYTRLGILDGPQAVFMAAGLIGLAGVALIAYYYQPFSWAGEEKA